MLKYVVLCTLACYLVSAEVPIHGIRPSNILGGPEQHASFSFVRPGLTQTSYAFNGPSSHQAFSSSIGNPHLAQRVLPNVAHALAYRNPGLGSFPIGPIAIPPPVATGPVPVSYQAPLDQASTLAYLQQVQQAQAQAQGHPEVTAYQALLAQYLALRQAQAQTQQIPEQVQLQQQQQHAQNLLGVAYSAAPSVAHVKVNGNGYKFDF